MVRIVSIKRQNARSLYLGDEMPPPVHASFDLRNASPFALVVDALWPRAYRVISVTGKGPAADVETIDVILDEKPLQQEIYDFSWRILTLSVVISIFTAGLVFAILQGLLVRPIRRITQSMIAFRETSEDATLTLGVGARRDEIGIAQRELADLQINLRAVLRKRSHLAGLGASVSKINHDLRSILATAQLVSDRLADSADPDVRRIAPTLVRSLDCAIALCINSLRYGRVDATVLDLQTFDVRTLVADVGNALALAWPPGVIFRNDVARNIAIVGDREQSFRVLLNLIRNAAEALTGAARGEIPIRAGQTGSGTTIDVIDHGPGIPEAVRLHLFEPFRGAARNGGTGLGLAIARDVTAAKSPW